MDNDWVKSICVVGFDDTLGQFVELQHPPYFRESELRALAFLAFPDSNSLSGETDACFAFTAIAQAQPVFCFSYFCQQKDDTSRRGYTQRAVLLVSQLPYLSLFKRVVRSLGPLYCSHGPGLFEVVESCFNGWGSIEPGVFRELPFLGQVFKYTVPTTDLHVMSASTGLSAEDLVQQLSQGYPGLFQDTNLFEEIPEKIITHSVWSMWEHLLRGQNLLVVGTSPAECSTMVFGVLALLSPLHFQGEYLPYTTIFDCDLNNLKHTQAFLGVTNPFFKKAVGTDFTVYSLTSDVKYKKAVKRPRALLTKLRRSNTTEQHQLLKEHFRDLTQALLAPFAEYFYTSSPTTTAFKPFDNDQFLQDLENTHFPLLSCTSRPKALRVYSDFIQTRTFLRWFSLQRERTRQNVRAMMEEDRFTTH